ncbi:MAG: O-antigen ligase family protein [Chloroflexi bacterium]|nr:MAG: O-antigen ligase family protein [Chloroflexota bacterium]
MRVGMRCGHFARKCLIRCFSCCWLATVCGRGRMWPVCCWLCSVRPLWLLCRVWRSISSSEVSLCWSRMAYGAYTPCLAARTTSRRQVFGFLHAWGIRIVAAAALLPMLLVLYLSQSRGAWVAIALATLFLLLLLLRSRKAVLIVGLGLLVALAVGGIIFHRVILAFLEGHQSVVGISTLSKRLYLWLSALRMIHDRPWFGFGLENWLCYYSANAVCSIPALYHHHYWILTIPGTNTLTGLSDEPTLSHPHNIFLDVWVSMGIFGLLAFIALIFLFFRLFSRILRTIHAKQGAALDYLRWMVLGVGAAMLAGLIQGQVDNAFLAPDMAFCFWILVTALLLLRVQSGTSWRGRISPEPAPPVTTEETHEATV